MPAEVTRKSYYREFIVNSLQPIPQQSPSVSICPSQNQKYPVRLLSLTFPYRSGHFTSEFVEIMDRSTYSPPSSPRPNTITITSSGLIQGHQKVESKKREVEAKAKQGEERADKLRREKLEEYNRLHVSVQARKRMFES